MDFDFAPVGFYFRVRLLMKNSLPGAETKDTSFMEVSGIGATMETEVHKEGGNLDSSYTLITGFKYDTLKLKRGISPKNSDFSVWCNTNLIENVSKQIITGTLEISLLKDNDNSFCNWSFFNAYPIKWSLDSFSSKKNDLAIETIEVCYSNFKRNQ
jgi:phage tail-like protein